MAIDLPGGASAIDVADMPGVGDGLNDHYFARIILRCHEPISLNDASNVIVAAMAVNRVNV